MLVAAAVHFGFSTPYAQCGEEKQATAQTPEYQREDITLKVGDRQFVATVLSPPKGKLAKHPALLVTLGADRHVALFESPFSLPSNAFLKHGHRTVSFDMPCHGQRIDRFGQWIDGFRASFVAGVDPFKMCVADGQAVITECIKRGWATPGRIATQGASRAAYMALRLLAADKRIAVAAGIAPVTDWRMLSEFGSVRDREDVADLQLTYFVEPMAGRHVYLAIGKSDDRVSTMSCQSFYQALEKAQVNAGYDSSYVELNLTDDPGHSCNSGYQRGVDFLLKWAMAQ